MSERGQVIPAQAVEAAAKAVYGGDHLDGSPHREAWLRDFRLALEAAAPHMLHEAKADAWDEGRQADDFEVSIGLDSNPYRPTP